MNNTQLIPPIAKAISVLKFLRAATSWLLLWGIITALVELVVVEVVSLGPRFGPLTTVVAPIVALPIATWLTLVKPCNDSRFNAWLKGHERKASGAKSLK